MPLMFGSIAPISTAAAAVGIASAVAVYALHHLRSRPRSKTVATLIFWTEVSRLSQKRALFSFPPGNFWTMLLLIAITTLLSLVLTADRWKSNASETAAPVFVCDIGSSMQSRLSGMVSQAKQDMNQWPTTPALITAGEQPILIAQPGEPSALLGHQLDQLQATNTASAAVLALNLAGNVVNDDAGPINWYTDQTAVPPGVGNSIVNRIRIIHAPSPTEAVAITGAVFETGESPFQGTLSVTIEGQSKSAMTLIAGDKQAALLLVDRRATVSFDNVPADGQVIGVRLKNAPGSPVEHEVKFQLPRCTPLRFYFVGPVPESLRDALLASGSESTSTAGCIAAGNQDQSFPADAAALIKVVRGDVGVITDQPIVEANGQPLLGGLSLEGAIFHHGPSVLVSQKLLLAGGSTVAGMSDGVCYLSSGLLDDDAELPKKAAFPVLMHRLAVHLAGWSAAPPVITTLRFAVDPLWDSDGEKIRANNVVYQQPVISSDSQEPARSKLSPVWPALPWTQCILGLALVLLGLEGFLIGFKKIV